MADLKTNYVDDVLDTSVNVKRKYRMIQNADGTVSFDDVTTYTQNGDSFGAKDINDTNTAVNELNSNLSNINENLTVERQALTTFTNSASGAIYIHKYGQVISVKVDMTNTSNWSKGTRYAIGAIPSQYRPENDIHEFVLFGNGVIAYFEWNSNGVIAFTPISDTLLANTYWVYYNFSYIRMI